MGNGLLCNYERMVHCSCNTKRNSVLLSDLIHMFQVKGVIDVCFDFLEDGEHVKNVLLAKCPCNLGKITNN
jgi:hypothetical protein